MKQLFDILESVLDKKFDGSINLKNDKLIQTELEKLQATIAPWDKQGQAAYIYDEKDFKLFIDTFAKNCQKIKDDEIGACPVVIAYENKSNSKKIVFINQKENQKISLSYGLSWKDDNGFHTGVWLSKDDCKNAGLVVSTGGSRGKSMKAVGAPEMLWTIVTKTLNTEEL